MNYLVEKIWSRPRGVVNASYKTINDFESSSEKECSKLDKENEKIYSKLLTQAEKAHDAIKHSGLSMNLEVPHPPRPSNRDRFLLWKKRNVSKKVIEQTEAVLFLESQGYKYNEHYEAYQAIDLAMEVKKSNGETIEFVDNSKNFDNVYNKNDKNILRRRSMIRLKENEKLPTNLQNKSRNRNSKIVVNEEYFSNQYQGPQHQHFEQTIQSPINIERTSSLSRTNHDIIQTSQTHDHFNFNRLSSVSESDPKPHITFPSPPSAPPSSNVCQKIIELNSQQNQNQNQNNTQVRLPNFSQIENQNILINNVKPSAPPASNNRKRINSCYGFEFEKNSN